MELDIERSGVAPFVTFLISTHNRREIVLQTLKTLAQLERDCEVLTETIVVDNASTDDTAASIAAQFPEVLLLSESKNRGACAKNAGLAHATGTYVMFLDDDSYPVAESIPAMVEHFEADAELGAAVFDVVLPNGAQECSAYPKVFIGCGTGFRREALQLVGGLPEEFFMQAEEYDLSFRLLAGGWDIRRFADLLVHHQKSSTARQPTRTTRLDARNNLMLITRYFPRPFVRPFASDWMRRYLWIAQTKGVRHQVAFWTGVLQGAIQSLRPGHRRPVSLTVFEQFAMIRQIHRRFDRALRDGGHRSVVLVDVGKNIYAYWLAAQTCDVEIVAIADSKLARSHRNYRGVPVVNDAVASGLQFDAVVVANTSPVQARSRRAAWRRLTSQTVIDLFASPEAVSPAVAAAVAPTAAA